MSYTASESGFILLPMTLHGRGGERAVQAKLDTGDPGAVTIGACLARLGEPVGPVEIMQSGTGPHRVCRVRFESIAAIAAHWASPLVNTNLDRCDDSAFIGLGYFAGARGLVLDHAGRRLTVLTDPGNGEEVEPHEDAWAWTPWRSSMSVEGKKKQLADLPYSIATEWSYEASRPFVNVWVGGEPVPCIVDTGADIDLILPDSGFVTGPTRRARVRGHGGSVSGWTGRIDGVELAGRRFDDVKVFVEERSSEGEDVAELGVIGMGLLARQPVWFDLEGRRLGLGAPQR